MGHKLVIGDPLRTQLYRSGEIADGLGSGFPGALLQFDSGKCREHNDVIGFGPGDPIEEVLVPISVVRMGTHQFAMCLEENPGMRGKRLFS